MRECSVQRAGLSLEAQKAWRKTKEGSRGLFSTSSARISRASQDLQGLVFSNDSPPPPPVSLLITSERRTSHRGPFCPSLHFSPPPFADCPATGLNLLRRSIQYVCAATGAQPAATLHIDGQLGLGRLCPALFHAAGVSWRRAGWLAAGRRAGGAAGGRGAARRRLLEQRAACPAGPARAAARDRAGGGRAAAGAHTSPAAAAGRHGGNRRCGGGPALAGCRASTAVGEHAVPNGWLEDGGGGLHALPAAH